MFKKLRAWSMVRLRQQLLPFFIHSVHHSAAVDCSSEDLTVGCLVRNGEMHIEDFLKHHFRLGAKHIVLLDNDSTDSTTFLAQKFENTTILQTRLPFKSHKLLLKNYLFHRFGKRGWFLIVDIDERFDFPGSDQITLTDFLRYLNQHGFTAALAHMLELYPAGSLDQWPTEGEQLRKASIWYDHTQLTPIAYPATLRNRLTNAEMQMYQGGIRKTVFGVDALLSKHPLLYRPGGAKLSLASSHWCHDSIIADVSCLLYHYKFDGTFRQKCAWAAQAENYYQASAEYKAYLQILEAQPNLELIQPTSQQFNSWKVLVEDGVLTFSEQYQQFLHHCAAQSSSVTERPPVT
jgi:hypothetical protein